MARKKDRVYRDGYVHVNRTLCRTCIYGPEPPIPLATREAMEQGANDESGAIVCHETTGTRKPTVCRGYYEVNRSAILRLAAAMSAVAFDPRPEP